MIVMGVDRMTGQAQMMAIHPMTPGGYPACGQYRTKVLVPQE